MKYLTKDKTYISIGVFFLLFQIILILNKFYDPSPDLFFWFCYHTPIIFAIAFLTKQIDIIKALVNVGFISQFVWVLDLIIKLIFDIHILGLTEFIFLAENKLPYIIPILAHIFSTNIALYITRKDKPNNRTLFYSALYIILSYIIILVFTMPDSNVNCINYMCGTLNIEIPFYKYLWPIGTFIIIILPTHLFQYLIYKSYK